MDSETGFNDWVISDDPFDALSPLDPNDISIDWTQIPDSQSTQSNFPAFDVHVVYNMSALQQYLQSCTENTYILIPKKHFSLIRIDLRRRNQSFNGIYYFSPNE